MIIPRIAVLLSSYNGELYIEEQILSIIAQNNVFTVLYIRDDGSSDSTVDILKKLTVKYPNIILDLAQNIGFIKSFFSLLSNVSEDFDYYAFADQDDVWLPSKLSAGVEALKFLGSDMPAMYCSRTEYVDASLAHLSYSPLYRKEKIGFGNALVQNIATGCTIIINPTARKLIIQKLPEKCLVHDWWIYLVVSAFGCVIFDGIPHIKYRQHGGNVIGASSSFIKNSINRTRRFFGSLRYNKTSSQIAEFNRVFKSKMTPTQIASVNKILSAEQGVRSRFSLIFNDFYWRQSFIDNVLLRIVMLTGKF
jgi:glycosyltransferase involved in cell wall biosynthesis